MFTEYLYLRLMDIEKNHTKRPKPHDLGNTTEQIAISRMEQEQCKKNKKNSEM